MQILNYSEQPPTQPVVALFGVYSAKMKLTFRHLKLMRSKKGHLFVAFPCQGKETSEGKKYIRHYEFDGELQKAFEKEILEALKPYCRDGRLADFIQ